MTNDELREAIGILSYLDPGHIITDEQWDAVLILSKLAEGVLRLPEEKKLIQINTSYPNMGGTNNQFDLGWNAYREEARKVIGLDL